MSFNVVAGQTLETIAGIVYGDPEKASFLRSVNPGIGDSPAPGFTLRTPRIGPQRTTIPTGIGDDDVTIHVDGTLFDRWTAVTLMMSADNVASFAFEANYDPEDGISENTFLPLSFKPVVISVGSEKAFDGTIIDVSFDQDTQKRTVTVSGYSKPGVLQDCNIPSGDELEFFEQNLEQIAAAVCAPYDIVPSFMDAPGDNFQPFVAATISQKIWSFLSRLCEQRSFVMTSDADGNLVFQKEAEDNTIFAQLEVGVPPVLGVASAYNPQEIYSTVTASGPVVIGDQPASFTVENPLVGDVFRAHVFEVRDAFGSELEVAANSRAGRMYGDAASISVSASSWRNSAGNMWQANKLVTLLAPEINVRTRYTFLIRNVTFEKTRDGGNQAILDLIFPGAFSGRLPETLPWT